MIPVFVQSGSFGCIYKPAFKCNDNDDTNNMISRLSLHEEKYINSERIYKNKLDLEKFLLLTKYHCEFNTNQILMA